MLWLVVLLAVAAAVLVVVGVVLAVGRESRERRGGLLELDTWEARNALAMRREIRRAPQPMLAVCGHVIADGADFVADDGYVFCSPACADERRLTHLDEHPELFDADRRGRSALRRCNPRRGVHFHGPGDRCECGERPNSSSVRPFAGGGDA